jgi:DNA N-6-adenine-methyltransferase (Dam)
VRVEHRSGNPNHLTPPRVLEIVRRLGPIGLDPASCVGNPTGARVHLTPVQDGLSKPWTHAGLVYVNPPYGRHKGQRCREWVSKAITEARDGAEIVMLLPARTDTAWMQAAMYEASALCFIAGRLVFVGQDQGAPFPSALLYYGSRQGLFRDVCRDLGITY